jgi:hypothetical protein
VADGQLIEAVVGNGNIETHYATIHKDRTTLTAPIIKYLNDQLELRDRRMCDLEAKIVDLESKMTALSDTVGDWRCTSVDSRFSHMTDFSLDEGLHFVGQGRGRGNKEVGDEEEDSASGDQKRNARKRKRAPKGEEGKQDNKGDKNGNGDQKRKAHKRKVAQKANKTTRDQITDANNRTTCAQVTYYKEYPPSQRGNRPATGANAGLINANIIYYSNAIFHCIASCANLDNYADFLWSPPNEEHQHFEL